MKPTYDEIVKWMKEYFAEYNVSAQDAGHGPRDGQVLRSGS